MPVASIAAILCISAFMAGAEDFAGLALSGRKVSGYHEGLGRLPVLRILQTRNLPSFEYERRKKFPIND